MGTIIETSVDYDGNTSTWFSGEGSNPAWTASQNSPLVSDCSTYDLCTLSNIFDGTSGDRYGKCIAFAGPNSNSPPYSIVIDLGSVQTFNMWRLSGATYYSFGTVHLNYYTSSGTFVTVPYSAITNTAPVQASGNTNTAFFQSIFSSPVTAQKWQVVIDSYNPLQLLVDLVDSQAKFQCYLCEVQFGIKQ